jgi:flagellar basal-body rod protein FlgF
MIKGFYSAVSAMVAGVERQKLLAHNATNINTPGFKEILSTLNDFEQTNVSFPPGGDANSLAKYVGSLGLGVELGPQVTNFEEAGLNGTGHEFDMAINGPGFFNIRTPDGDRVTRDGRFLKDAQGQLVTIEGFQVLNSNGQPIKLPDGPLVVNSDGSMLVNGASIGTLGMDVFQNPETDLVRDENNKFVVVGQPAAKTGATVLQGYLEMSNVNASRLMTQMVMVSRLYEAAQKLVTNQDELLGRSISTLGRIS